MADETTETTDSVNASDEAITTSYVDGKFNSIGTLEDGYRELRTSYDKKLGGFDGSPEKYTMPEGVEGDEYSFVQDWGKENQLSDKGFNSLITKYNEAMAERQTTFQKAEMEKLGENADIRVKNVSDWLNATVGDKAGALDLVAGGADGIEGLEMIMKAGKQTAPATENPRPIIDKDKLDYMQFQEKDAYGGRRYESDPSYRKKVLEMRERLLEGD